MGKRVAGSSLETFLRRFCPSFSVVVYVVSLVFSLVFSLSETCVSARSINQRYSYQSSSSLSKDLKRKQQRTTTTTTTTDVRLQSGAILSKRETTEREGEASARLAEIVLPRTATTATARGGGTRTRTETIFLEEDEGD